MLNKKKVLETIKELPEEFSVDELFDRIILLQKIKQGEEDIKAGRVLTTEQVKERLKKWLN